jgi:murein DD-endopeptidase MepM/ murein hydrolase activator NlpD
MAVDRGEAPPGWPIRRWDVTRIGESLTASRRGSYRPHKGVDLFAKAGTSVVAPVDGVVLRVVDGRQSSLRSQVRAGLFVDLLDTEGRIHRFLHLGSVSVKKDQRVRQGQPLGTVAEAGTSGVNTARPHLHYEIRHGDYAMERADYGAPEDPLPALIRGRLE